MDNNNIVAVCGEIHEKQSFGVQDEKDKNGCGIYRYCKSPKLMHNNYPS